MAEISAPEQGKGGQRKLRSRKMSIKIDMTPMVDLGFLLITFFMLTTVLIKPAVLDLAMPVNNGPTGPIKKSQSLTVILGEANKVYYYQGIATDPTTKIQVTDFSDKGLRAVLFNYKARIGDPFTVVIKSTDQAKYGNMVDLLDELAITNNHRYGIVDISESDKKLIAVK
jgi:biopolymer transport protein ExbD